MPRALASHTAQLYLSFKLSQLQQTRLLLLVLLLQVHASWDQVLASCDRLNRVLNDTLLSDYKTCPAHLYLI